MSRRIINSYISNKIVKLTQFFLFLNCLFGLVKSDEVFTKESMEVHTYGGLGIGTLLVIIAIAIGVCIMILGLAFATPGLFVFIGILFPLIIFIFVVACPKESDTKQVEYWENKKKNNYIVARFFHFLVMGLLFLGLLGPAFIKWSITIIPQKVDSSSQKDFYDEKYMEALDKQRKRKYNMEETDVSLPQRLPLSMNKRKNNLNNNINNQSNSLIQNNSQNISKNLIDNTNVENSNDFQRPILPSKTKRNKFNENRKKFTGFIRKKDKK